MNECLCSRTEITFGLNDNCFCSARLTIAPTTHQCIDSKGRTNESSRMDSETLPPVSLSARSLTFGDAKRQQRTQQTTYVCSCKKAQRKGQARRSEPARRYLKAPKADRS